MLAKRSAGSIHPEGCLAAIYGKAMLANREWPGGAGKRRVDGTLFGVGQCWLRSWGGVFGEFVLTRSGMVGYSVDESAFLVANAWTIRCGCGLSLSLSPLDC